MTFLNDFSRVELGLLTSKIHIRDRSIDGQELFDFSTPSLTTLT